MVTSTNGIFGLVAAGKIVHPTVASLAALFDGQGIKFVPTGDLPSIRLGLIWVTSHDNAGIRALANVAANRNKARARTGKGEVRRGLPAERGLRRASRHTLILAAGFGFGSSAPLSRHRSATVARSCRAAAIERPPTITSST